jgi:hypothetical protein
MYLRLTKTAEAALLLRLRRSKEAACGCLLWLVLWLPECRASTPEWVRGCSGCSFTIGSKKWVIRGVFE